MAAHLINVNLFSLQLWLMLQDKDWPKAVILVLDHTFLILCDEVILFRLSGLVGCVHQHNTPAGQ
jgi:hypothetical protein